MIADCYVLSTQSALYSIASPTAIPIPAGWSPGHRSDSFPDPAETTGQLLHPEHNPRSTEYSVLSDCLASGCQGSIGACPASCSCGLELTDHLSQTTADFLDTDCTKIPAS